MDLQLEPYREVLTRQARRWANGDRAGVEDLVQATFTKALAANANGFFDGQNEQAWLFSIMGNLVRDRARKAARRPEVPLAVTDDELVPWEDDFPADLPHHVMVAPVGPESVADAVLGAILEPELEAALTALPWRWRAILVMAADGMEYCEIAEELSIPIGSVMSGLHRARARVQAALVRAA